MSSNNYLLDAWDFFYWPTQQLQFWVKVDFFFSLHLKDVSSFCGTHCCWTELFRQAKYHSFISNIIFKKRKSGLQKLHKKLNIYLHVIFLRFSKKLITKKELLFYRNTSGKQKDILRQMSHDKKRNLIYMSIVFPNLQKEKLLSLYVTL